MEFHILKKSSISDSDIIDDISAVMKSVGKHRLTIKEYDSLGKFNSSTAIRRFGSWNDAISKAGGICGNYFHSDDDMMNNIKVVWLARGKQPSRRDMDNRSISKISSNAYLRRYGTWYNALEEFITYINESDIDDIIGTTTMSKSTSTTHQTKREPSDRLKVRVLMRDGNKCRICGVECNDGLHNIHFDHIIPWSKGGETTYENLQVLCSSCNEAKGNL